MKYYTNNAVNYTEFSQNCRQCRYQIKYNYPGYWNNGNNLIFGACSNPAIIKSIDIDTYLLLPLCKLYRQRACPVESRCVNLQRLLSLMSFVSCHGIRIQNNPLVTINNTITNKLLFRYQGKHPFSGTHVLRFSESIYFSAFLFLLKKYMFICNYVFMS